jgi:hypothetical protein
MPDEIKTDDQLLEDLLDEEIKAAEGKTPDAPSTDELNALKSQVEELTTANAGLLKAKQAQTKSRQGAEGRLAQLEGAVGTILSQRQQQGIESVTETQAADAKSQGIPVTYDDDGNGWIDPNIITQLTSPYEQRINELEAKLQQTDANSNATAQAQKVMDGIIGSDERFGPASGRYRAARKWVEDQVFDFTQSQGISRTLTSAEALNHVFNDAYAQSEFKKEFGDIDLIDVVTAEDSELHFRRTLDNIATVMTPKDDLLSAAPKEKMDSRFQKVLDKPSTLGTQANAKAGETTLLERVGSLGTEDIMNFSDDQIDALMKLAGKS